MSMTSTLRKVLALPATLALIAGGVMAGAATAVAAPGDPFVTATPSSLTDEDLAATGVRLQGLSFNTGGPLQNQIVRITAPSGQVETRNQRTTDGTFDITFIPTNDTEVGTYQVRSAGFAGVPSQSVGTTTFEVTDEPVEPEAPPASIAVDPTVISPDDFLADGVQATGRTFDTGSEVNIERSNLVLTSPSGDTASFFDLTSDGTFDVNIKPKGDIAIDPVETGTYTLTATSLLNPEFTATTTFEVQGEQAPPPASIAVTPESLSTDAFIADGVRATGRTFDTGSEVNIERSNLVLTSPSGETADYFDLTSDGTFGVTIRPKDDVLTDPLEVGTWTITATSLQRPEFTATTTFQVTAPVVPPVDRDPEVNADPQVITQSDFREMGLNLNGFTEDTPGPLTRQDIFVTDPSGDSTRCSDFTGDGTFDVQVYPAEAPDSGPEGQRTCSLVDGPQEEPNPADMDDLMPSDGIAPLLEADGSVEIGTYDVVSYGFIREDARATTTFEVIADPVDPGPVDPDPVDPDPADPDPTDPGPGADDDQPGGVGVGDGGKGGVDGDAADGDGFLPATGAGSFLPLVAAMVLLLGGAALAKRGRLFRRTS